MFRRRRLRDAAVIPVIPFCAELQRIGKTIETVTEVANVLETHVNTDYYR